MMEAMALMEMASGGTSPSRQGAGTETSVPELEFRGGGAPWSLSGVSSSDALRHAEERVDNLEAKLKASETTHKKAEKDATAIEDLRQRLKML
ncbi:hypothetical protein QYE76_003962 [Lolium multiflorum]|uniref:Uncharacterized protein n=1 Tax=Lolium multiflorum TaxID=4521 RepID=A0AAD8RRN6_LOLMU|nr:hypothetical protein QYE76_003962 [Lolium multiflorum]